MEKISRDAHYLGRVSKNQQVNFLNVTLVRMGMVTALSQFMVGLTLGNSMGSLDAMIAICLGSFILEFISLGLGYAGMKEGLSTTVLSRWCGFGRIGSALVSFTVAISLIGWFGVQNSVLANSILKFFDYKLSFEIVTAIVGIGFTFLVSVGFKALTLTAKIAVPLFFLVVLYIFLSFFLNHGVIVQDNTHLNLTTLSISEAATVIAGAFVAGALVTPDISRYCKTKSHLFWMVTLCIIVGEFFINGISIYIAKKLNTSNVIDTVIINAGFIGLISLILSVIKVNDVNLYSSSLGFSNALYVLMGKSFNYSKITIFVGLAGTVLSMVGILNHFVDFLSMLGIIFPPIAGVMLVDYYILKTSRKILDETREKGVLPDDSQTPLIGFAAIIACIVGTLVGVFFNFGIPSLNSILVAGITYFLLMKMKIYIKLK